MVDLEHLQPAFEWIAISEGVEPGAQDHRLGHAARRNTFSEGAFSDGRAERDEQPKARRTPASRIGQDGVPVFAEYLHGERVFEDAPAVERLVRRPMPRGAQGGSARLSFLHGSLSATIDGAVVRPLARLGKAHYIGW